MKTKEVKIEIPQGYEIDNEKSTLECIKFKPIKKNITYKEICDYLFKDKRTFYMSNRGEIGTCTSIWSEMDKNNATSEKQLERLLTLNQLLNIAEYYNKKNIQQDYSQYCIICENKYEYHTICYKELHCLLGIVALFNRKEDAQAVIDNPNFREILDTIYKN
nr:MAG TPA: hypothetical protein [Crassvirales sp.]